MMESAHNRTRQPSTLQRYDSRASNGDHLVSPIEPDAVPTWSNSKRVGVVAEEREQPEREALGSPSSPAEVEGSSIPWIAQKMSRMRRQHHQQQQVICPSVSEAATFDFGLPQQASAEGEGEPFTIPRRPVRR